MSMFIVSTKNRFYYSFLFFLIFKTSFISAQCPINITSQPSDASVCSGGNTSFSISVTPSVDITGYQWQVNTGSGFNNITNGPVYTNATTTTLNISGANSGYTGFTYRCIIYNNCPGGDVISDAKTLTVTPNAWTGAVSSDWHTAGNWCSGVVPTNHDDIEIVTAIGFPNEPIITPGTQGDCRNLTFDNFIGGLTFTGAVLNVSGDMTLTSGTFFTNSTSYLVLNGTTTQYLNDGWLVVNNLTLSNSNNLVVNNANITVSNTLKLNAGKIILGNNILVVNNISAVSDTRYICTCDALGISATGGGVRKTIAASGSFTFPVGPNLISYNPVTVTNASGPGEEYIVRVDHSALPGATATESVGRTWHIEETTSGGNTVDMTLDWDAMHEGGSFNHGSGNCRILKSDGVDISYTGYNVQIGAASNPSGTTWRKSITGVSSLSSWGVTSQSCTPSVTTQPSDATTCSGGNTSFTVAATGFITGYQWQVNTGSGFTNITNGGVYSNATTTTLNLTGVNSTYNNYLYKCIVYDGCSGGIATNNKTLTITANTWTGLTNTDWNTASNWSCGVVPTTNDDVAVNPTLTMNNAVITSGTQAYCRNMTKGGNFLKVLNFSGATLNISGNLTYNSGSIITDASSFLNFNGTTTQTLSGTPDLVVSNLTINNNFVSTKNIRVNGTLDISGGKLIMNDNFLTVTTLTGADNTHYICTCDELGNATPGGGVRKTIAASASYTFPVGSNLTSYTPVTITNTSGPSEEFKIYIEDIPLAGANATQTVAKTWTVDETTPGGNTATIKFQWNQSEEGGSFNRTNCAILKTNGTTIDYSGYSIQAGAAATEGGTAWSKTLTGVTAFSPWGVSSQSSLLPIELLSFKAAILNKNTAQIDWEITPNSTPKAFEILKSEDGEQYQSIAFINAYDALKYSFKDINLKQGISYFKLKMIDNEDIIEYSKIVSVQNNAGDVLDIQILPNIVNDKTQVKITGTITDYAQIQIFNIKGSFIKTIPFKTNENNLYSIECHDMPAGMYWVRVLTEGGISKSVRLLKQ
jgi:hypothetical protein